MGDYLSLQKFHICSQHSGYVVITSHQTEEGEMEQSSTQHTARQCDHVQSRNTIENQNVDLDRHMNDQS